MPDVFKLLKDLELKAVGLDPQTNKMQEGYFTAFRSVGLPIHKEDFANPWSPLGVNLDKAIPASAPSDPKNAQSPAAGGQLDENKVATASIARAQQSYLNTFLLTDDKLQMNNAYAVMPGSSKVSDSWFAIITGANGIPTTTELADAMKKAYEKAKAKLMDPEGNMTQRYNEYLRFEGEYRSKLRALHTAYAAAFTDPMKLQNWPITGTLFQQEVDEALDRWQGFGFKEEIEGAINTLAAQGTDPAIALIARAKKRYNNSLFQFMGIGMIPYTLMSPATWYDSDNDDGWTEYSSREFHTESHFSGSSTSYGGGGGFNVGFWSASASFNHSTERQNLNVQTTNLKMSMKYSVVDIKRPWLDTSLLNLKNWFIVGDYKKGCISNGSMNQHLPQNALEPSFLPSIVTSFILIKDLRISWDNWKSDWQTLKQSTSASASVGFCCFSLNGHYEHHNEQRDFTADDTGEELHIPGIQLVGYVSTINPMAPQVDSSQHMAPPQ